MPDNSQQPESVFHLAAPSELREAVIMGQGLPTEINGNPVKYFWGDGIKAGDYQHPTKGFKLSVDRKRIDGWVSNFQRMRQAGVDVPVVADHKEQAAHSLGYIVDVKRDGDKLKLLHQMIGTDAILMASRNKISLGIDPNYTDGKANKYGDVIRHSSFTPVPVVSGLGNLIAASRGPAEGDIFELAAPQERSLTMPLTADELSTIRGLPGVAQHLSAEASEDDLIRFAIAYAGEIGNSVQTLSAQLDEARGQILTMSNADEVQPPSAEKMHYLGRTLNLSRDEAVKAIGATAVTEAAKRFLGTETFDTGLLTLSRETTAEDARTADGMRRMIDFCELAKLAKPDPRAVRTIELSRGTDEPDNTENPLLKAAEKMTGKKAG